MIIIITNNISVMPYILLKKLVRNKLVCSFNKFEELNSFSTPGFS